MSDASKDDVAGQFYPWQETLHARLARLHESDRLPHALLLSGPRHLGKRAFALAMAGYVLCAAPSGGAHCGSCDNCRLIAAGTHPDFRHITPTDSKLIRIEQIRDLIDWAGQTAQRSGMRAVVIEPAEQMNVYSANALLKCLEEPGDRMLIMLVSDQPGRLLPTIRSRCQHVDFTIPSADESLDWLRAQKPESDQLDLLLSIGGGAPLSVMFEFDEAFLERRTEVAGAMEQLVMGRNPLDVARTFAKGEPDLDLALIYSLFADALRLQLTQDENILKNRDLSDVVEKLAGKLSRTGLFRSIDAIARDRRVVSGSSNANVALLFEALMVEIAGFSAL